MEIQGSWIPLDVLKYITQFLWVKDHREGFKRVCKVFYRAFKEDPPKPPVYIVPVYGSVECGLVTMIRRITCYLKNVEVMYDSNAEYFVFGRRDGREFCFRDER
jgi:hypothetical protein